MFCCTSTNLYHTELCPFLYLCSYENITINKFSMKISTPTTSLESINNAMRSRYLKIRPDASVFSLIEALVEVAFLEMEKRYIQATVKQMEFYHRSRCPIPKYLLNRPRTVQGECLFNQEKAKAITNSMIGSIQEGVFLVSGNPKHAPKSGYNVKVNIHVLISLSRKSHVSKCLQYLTIFQRGNGVIYLHL